jgi:endonuclease III-like uncharacterized protein
MFMAIQIIVHDFYSKNMVQNIFTWLNEYFHEIKKMFIGSKKNINRVQKYFTD